MSNERNENTVAADIGDRDLLEYLSAAEITGEHLEGDYSDWDESLEYNWAKKHPDAPESAKILAEELERLEGSWPAYLTPAYKAQLAHTGEIQELLEAACPVSSAKFECVHRVGGGEYVERVWKYLPTGQLIRATARYYSYDGISYWSDLHYAVARQRMETYYVEEGK